MFRSPKKSRTSKLDAVTLSSVSGHSLDKEGRTRQAIRPDFPSVNRLDTTATVADPSVLADFDGASADGNADTAIGNSNSDDDDVLQRCGLSPDAGRLEAIQEEVHQDSGWERIRPALYELYIQTLVQTSEAVQERKRRIKAGVEEAVNAAASECPNCNASSQELSVRKTVEVLWVGSSYRFLVEVPVQLCHACGQLFAVNPLQAGCFPSTPVHAWDLTKAPYGSRPIWFDVSLLKEVDVQLNVIKRLSMDRLSAAILRTHENNECFEALSWDSFRKKLAQAVAEMGHILQRCDDMRELGAEDYPSGLLANCGGCWFAGKSGEVCGKQYDAYPLHSAYVDWNFKMGHLRSADRCGPVEEIGTEAPANARYFIPDAEVLHHLQQKDASQPLLDDGKLCSDFRADQVLGRTADGKYDITSLGVCLCRHGFVAYMMNSFTGERHAYATLFMARLLQEGKPPQFVWYDINCRWSVSFKKWLESQPPEIRSLAEGMQFPLPPFHLYAHSVECQRQCASVRMVGAGKANGEPHENWNGDFGPLGKTTQYMTRPNRQARIERAAHQYTQDRALRLPAQLCRMEVRAKAAQHIAETNAASIMEKLVARGISNSEIQARAAEHAHAAAESSQLEMSWEARLAEAKLVVYKAQQAETDQCTPSLSLLFEDPAFAKLSNNSAKVKSARATIRRVERQQAGELAGADVEIGSEGFEVLLARFVGYKIMQLQLELERLARVRLDVDALMPSLAERPGDQARLMKTLQKSAATIDSKAAKLKGWVTGSFLPEHLLPPDILALRTSAAAWDFSQFRRGVFPWQEDPSALDDLTTNQLISRIVLHNRERRRCTEERALLQQERELSLRLYRQQQSALERALADKEQELAAVHAAAPGEDDTPSQVGSLGTANQVAALKGRAVLLQAQLRRVECIAAAARRAFAAADPVHAMGEAEECAPDYLGNDGAATLVLAADVGVEDDGDDDDDIAIDEVA